MRTVDIIFATLATIGWLAFFVSVPLVFIGHYRRTKELQRWYADELAKLSTARDAPAEPAPITEPDPWPEQPTWADVQAEAHRFLEAGKKVA